MTDEHKPLSLIQHEGADDFVEVEIPASVISDRERALIDVGENLVILARHGQFTPPFAAARDRVLARWEQLLAEWKENEL